MTTLEIPDGYEMVPLDEPGARLGDDWLYVNKYSAVKAVGVGDCAFTPATHRSAYGIGWCWVRPVASKPGALPMGQEAPKPNARPHVVELVIADLRARSAHGLQKYGTRLQPFNGRSGLRDLYEELLDAANYARQVVFEVDTLTDQVEQLSVENAKLRGDVQAAEARVQQLEGALARVREELRDWG